MPACAASSSSGCSRWCGRSASARPSSPGRAMRSGSPPRPPWNWWNGAWCRRSVISRWCESARRRWRPPPDPDVNPRPAAYRLPSRVEPTRGLDASRPDLILSIVKVMCHYDDVTSPTSNPCKCRYDSPLGHEMMKNFLEQLRIQRWDDHRYYHHSRINQSLHFVSAISFLISYVYMFFDPVVSALVAWLVSMTSRQAGHFFFEPKGYDHLNHATHEHKEDIKVGYNLRRKVVLMTIWAASPLVLYFDPTLFGLFKPWASTADFVRQVAKIWLVVGIGGLLFRTVHLFFIRDVETGLVWMTKIVTDPFNDFKLYHKAPLALLRGELIDPGLDILEHGLELEEKTA